MTQPYFCPGCGWHQCKCAPIETRPAPAPLPEQDARPPEEACTNASSVPAGTGKEDLQGLPVVPADGETLPSVAAVGEAPALDLKQCRLCRESKPRAEYHNSGYCPTCKPAEAPPSLPKACNGQVARACQTDGCTRPAEARALFCIDCHLSEAKVLPSDDRNGLAYLYFHEIVCLLCGRQVGMVQSPTDRPPAIALIPRTVRCTETACGGRPIWSGEWTRQLAHIVPTGPIRRGRPPRVEAMA